MIVQWELSCFMLADGRTDRQTDRQTDMMKPVVAFRNFANAPKYDFQIRIFYIKICRI